jgi:hypothetical protein
MCRTAWQERQERQERPQKRGKRGVPAMAGAGVTAVEDVLHGEVDVDTCNLMLCEAVW